jgi:hypothetical protein
VGGLLPQEVEEEKLMEEDPEAALERGSSVDVIPLKLIKGVPRFLQDLRALEFLLAQVSPSKVAVHCLNVISMFYGFADASGLGFRITVMKIMDGTCFTKMASGIRIQKVNPQISENSKM